MAVHALPRWHVPAQRRAAAAPTLVLVVALVAPGLDLFSLVQPGVLSATVGVLGAAASAAALLGTLLRFPRTSWLFAATLAALASLAMRLLGADVAPLLSLLSIAALGIGGAFQTPEVSLEVA